MPKTNVNRWDGFSLEELDVMYEYFEVALDSEDPSLSSVIKLADKLTNEMWDQILKRTNND